jgi:hypothetical protein
MIDYEYKIKKLEEEKLEIEKKLEEKNMILKSELSMNQYLKIQLESSYIQLDLVADLNRQLCDKIAKERVVFKNKN